MSVPLPPTWAVPSFDVLELTARKNPYAVCVFVLNEGERVRRQLAKMQSLPGVDVVVADGGSTDGSLDEGCLRSVGVSARLTKTGSGKLGAQMRMAFAWCLGRGYDGVIAIDGNDKDDTRAVPRFAAELAAGVDYVQGSRFVPGGKAVNTPLARWVGLRFVHAPMISLAAGLRYTDTTNGFRGYSRRFLTDPRVALFRDCFAGYELHYYLAIAAARPGFRVKEVPVTRAYPKHEPTPTKIKGFRGNLGILKTLAYTCVVGHDPSPEEVRALRAA